MSNEEFNFDLDESPSDVPSPTDQPVEQEGAEEEVKGKGKKGKKAAAKKAKKAKKEKPKKKERTKRKRERVAVADSRPKTPQFNTYTSMLLVALLCLSAACLLLYLELMQYGSFPWWKTDGLG